LYESRWALEGKQPHMQPSVIAEDEFVRHDSFRCQANAQPFLVTISIDCFHRDSRRVNR